MSIEIIVDDDIVIWTPDQSTRNNYLTLFSWIDAEGDKFWRELDEKEKNITR